MVEIQAKPIPPDTIRQRTDQIIGEVLTGAGQIARGMDTDAGQVLLRQELTRRLATPDAVDAGLPTVVGGLLEAEARVATLEAELQKAVEGGVETASQAYELAWMVKIARDTAMVQRQHVEQATQLATASARTEMGVKMGELISEKQALEANQIFRRGVGLAVSSPFRAVAALTTRTTYEPPIRLGKKVAAIVGGGVRNVGGHLASFIHTNAEKMAESAMQHLASTDIDDRILSQFEAIQQQLSSLGGVPPSPPSGRRA